MSSDLQPFAQLRTGQNCSKLRLRSDTLASHSLFRKFAPSIVARMHTAALRTMSTILSVDPLSFPFATDSPFLFGVHHLSLIHI